MFSQQTDSFVCSDMECGNMYSDALGQAWCVDQNYVIENSEKWPQPPQTPYYVTKGNQHSKNNIYYAQSLTTSDNYYDASKTTPSSWRKEASIADWEAYLYSSIPVKINSQTPENTVTVSNNNNPNSMHNLVRKATPRAHISFIHTNNGVFKPIVKRKRKRTSFTTEQVEALESIFYKRPYISREERQILMEKLQVSDKAIKVWFQNRRLKVKKEKEEQELESSDSEIVDAHETEALAHVEALIYKADEFGYVTLDDRAINQLVHVIDNFIPKDADLGSPDSERSDNRLCSVSESECSVIYEPISPPDLSDNNSQENCTQKWETFEAIEPKKSFQRLLDVHMHEYSDSNLCVFY